MPEATTQYPASNASDDTNMPALAIADSSHIGGPSALPIDAEKVRRMLQSIRQVDELRNQLNELEGFPIALCETEHTMQDLTTLLSEALTWAAVHGDTTGAARMPDAIIVDGERFDIVLHHDRGIYLSEFEGKPHSIMLERGDSMNILGHLISKAREQVRQKRDLAESRDETWPRPEPSTNEPVHEKSSLKEVLQHAVLDLGRLQATLLELENTEVFACAPTFGNAGKLLAPADALRADLLQAIGELTIDETPISRYGVTVEKALQAWRDSVALLHKPEAMEPV
ncbi:MAG: hypothetical protein AAF711_04935 [Planctomycetota bacterium]